MQHTTPEDERQRLEALARYRVLDTPPEEDFDRVVALAADICDAPIALISLIDRQRQWFKAKVGLAVNETPRAYAFCAHTIRQDDLFQVEDASRDERFRNNPLVTGTPRIRFYAGVPLVVETGHHLGTLCVIDTLPRVLTAAQAAKLSILARHVSYKLDFRLQDLQLKEDLAALLVKPGALHRLPR